MRELAGLFRFLLSVVGFVGAVNFAFVLVEVYWVSSGRILPGQTIEYFERPARPLGELIAMALGIFAITASALFGRWRLKRWEAAESENAKLAANGESTN